MGKEKESGSGGMGWWRVEVGKEKESGSGGMGWWRVEVGKEGKGERKWKGGEWDDGRMSKIKESGDGVSGCGGGGRRKKVEVGE